MTTLVNYPTGVDVAAYLGRASDQAFITGPAQQAADLAISAASSYTRGNGFDDTEALMPASLYSAVLLRAVRLVANVQQLVSQETDGASINYGAAGQGFTNGELLALNEFRRMACSI